MMTPVVTLWLHGDPPQIPGRGLADPQGVTPCPPTIIDPADYPPRL